MYFIYYVILVISILFNIVDINAAMKNSRFEECKKGVHPDYNIFPSHDLENQSKASIFNPSLVLYENNCGGLKEYVPGDGTQSCDRNTSMHSWARLFYAYCAPDDRYKNSQGIVYAGTYGTDQGLRSKDHDTYKKALANCMGDDSCCLNKVNKWGKTDRNAQYSDLKRYDLDSRRMMPQSKQEQGYCDAERQRKTDLIQNALARSDKTCKGIEEELDNTFNRKCLCAERCYSKNPESNGDTPSLYVITCGLVPEIPMPPQCPGITYTEDGTFSINRTSNNSLVDIKSVSILPLPSIKRSDNEEVSTYFAPKIKVNIVGAEKKFVASTLKNESPKVKKNVIKKTFILSHNTPGTKKHKIKVLDKELKFTTEIIRGQICANYYSSKDIVIKSGCFDISGIPKPKDINPILASNGDVIGISFYIEGYQNNEVISLLINETYEDLNLSVYRLQKDQTQSIIQTRKLCINPNNPADFIDDPKPNIDFLPNSIDTNEEECPNNYEKYETYVQDPNSNTICLVGWKPKPELVTILDPISQRYVLAKELPKSFIPYVKKDNRTYINYQTKGPIRINDVPNQVIDNFVQDSQGRYKYQGQYFHYEKEKRFFRINKEILEYYPTIYSLKEFEGIAQQVILPNISKNDNRVLISSDYVKENDQNIIFSAAQHIDKHILDPILANLCIVDYNQTEKFVFNNMTMPLNQFECNILNFEVLDGGSASNWDLSNKNCPAYSGRSANYKSGTIELDRNSPYQFIKFNIGKGGNKKGMLGESSSISLCKDIEGTECLMIVAQEEKSTILNADNYSALYSAPDRNIQGHKISSMLLALGRQGECITQDVQGVGYNPAYNGESDDQNYTRYEDSQCASNVYYNTDIERQKDCTKFTIGTKNWCQTYCNFNNVDQNLGFETCNQHCDIYSDKDLNYTEQCLDKKNTKKIEYCNSTIKSKCEHMCYISTNFILEPNWCNIFCNIAKQKTYVGHITCNSAMLNFNKCKQDNLYPPKTLPVQCEIANDENVEESDKVPKENSANKENFKLVPQEAERGSGGCISIKDKKWQYGGDGVIVFRCK